MADKKYDWKPYEGGNFKKVHKKTSEDNRPGVDYSVYEYVYDLAKQVMNEFPGLTITSAQRDGAVTAYKTPSDHGLRLGIDLSGWGSSDAGYIKIAKALVGHPYIKYCIGDNLWNPKGDDNFVDYKYGGHNNHCHLSFKTPEECAKIKDFGAGGLTEEQANAYLLIRRNYLTKGTKRREGTVMEDAPKFVVLHSSHHKSKTADEVMALYRDKPNSQGALHGLVDHDVIYELVPTSSDDVEKPEIVYHVAFKTELDNEQFKIDANKGALALGLCFFEDDSKNKAAYKSFIRYAAYIAYHFKLDVKRQFVSHKLIEKEAEDIDDALKAHGRTYSELINDIKKEYDTCTKDKIYAQDGKVVYMDNEEGSVGSGNKSKEAMEIENDGFVISTKNTEAGTGVIIVKKPFRQTPAQPVYPDLLGNYKILSEEEQADINAKLSEVADDDGNTNSSYVAGMANYINYDAMQNKGIEVARIFFNYEDYVEREKTTDMTEKRYKQKTPNAGRPVNFNHAYPVDEKIEELEQHVPFLKIHQLAFDMPLAHTVDLASIVMDLSDKTEKRLVQLENVVATLMRYTFRLASRVNINCVYYGGHDTTRKYAAIRCLHHDRLEDGGLMTLDQCLNCTRFEPILGKAYDLTDINGQETEMVMDNNLLSYSSMKEHVEFTRKEEMPTQRAVKKLDGIDKKRIKQRAKEQKDFVDIWEDGYEQDWNFVPVEAQKPHVIYEDGFTTKTLDSNYNNQAFNDPTGAAFTDIHKEMSPAGFYDGSPMCCDGEGKGGDGSSIDGSSGDYDLGGYSGLSFLETAQEHIKIFKETSDSTLKGFVKEAETYAKNAVTQTIASMKKYKYEDVIKATAKKVGMDPLLILAYAATESTGNPDAGTGSYRGLLQLNKSSLPSNFNSMSMVEKAKAGIEAGAKFFMENKMAAVQRSWKVKNWMAACVIYNTGEALLPKSGDAKTTFDKIYDEVSKDAVSRWGSGKRGEVGKHFPKIVYCYTMLLKQTDIGKSMLAEGSTIKGKIGDNAITFPFADETVNKKDIKLISGYGIRSKEDDADIITDEKRDTKNGEEMHHGVDLKVEEGTAILAVADGTVVWVGESDKGNAGYGVRIRHNKDFYTSYYHMKEQTTVKEGDKVSGGSKIGVVGSSGNAETNHLHFEVWKGGSDKKKYSTNPAEAFSPLSKSNVSTSKKINGDLKKLMTAKK
ncbi:peptidoglycan DD-metalloendopeptidase family protein [Kurthia sp. Dielmo]|uniref:peptidoglycan DD-metalloendopeptidase family protein n=1 Tax=Kurthia sp. Dielmo TaxID=1033738 RepID=UPI001123CACA|nr:peptidoglycan DD-metalloendopeptidase family protein [Kurthia sp. Dielmo]